MKQLFPYFCDIWPISMWAGTILTYLPAICKIHVNFREFIATPQTKGATRERAKGVEAPPLAKSMVRNDLFCVSVI